MRCEKLVDSSSVNEHYVCRTREHTVCGAAILIWRKWTNQRGISQSRRKYFLIKGWNVAHETSVVTHVSAERTYAHKAPSKVEINFSCSLET